MATFFRERKSNWAPYFCLEFLKIDRKCLETKTGSSGTIDKNPRDSMILCTILKLLLNWSYIGSILKERREFMIFFFCFWKHNFGNINKTDFWETLYNLLCWPLLVPQILTSWWVPSPIKNKSVSQTPVLRFGWPWNRDTMLRINQGWYRMIHNWKLISRNTRYEHSYPSPFTEVLLFCTNAKFRDRWPKCDTTCLCLQRYRLPVILYFFCRKLCDVISLKLPSFFFFISRIFCMNFKV